MLRRLCRVVNGYLRYKTGLALIFATALSHSLNKDFDPGFQELI